MSTTATRHRSQAANERKAIRLAREVIRELGDDATVEAVETAVTRRLGLTFGSTLVWTLHETVAAQRRREQQGQG